MALETAPFINGLAPANPPGSDRIHQGDDHIRLIKAALRNTFPNLTGAMTLTQGQLNALASPPVPVGLIAAWYGLDTTVPAGWAICNGQVVARSDGTGNITTPDLRSRVIVGVDDSLEVGDIFGAPFLDGVSVSPAGAHGHTGSAARAGEHTHGGNTGTHALTVDEMPNHHHGNGVTDDGAGHVMVRGTQPSPTITSRGVAEDASGPLEGLTESVGGGAGHAHPVNPDGGHTHDVTLNGAGDHTHTLGTITTLQPSMALHHIMKI